MQPVRDGQKVAFVSVVTEIELLIKPLREGDEFEVERVKSLLNGRQISVLDLDRHRIAPTAAELRAEYRLSLTDATIVATALHTNCDVLIGNDERCARRVREIPYVFLDDLVKEMTP
jgi:predicted nucleic acid-binding protein